MSQNMVEIKGVKKYFKNIKAVDGVDLNIAKGEFVALLGPNGAGKTTLVEMVEGIQIPDEGQISITRKTWKENRTELHKMIGISLQETRFMDKINVRETLCLFASFYGKSQTRVDEILHLINLTEKARERVNALSGGQRQRLALGIALINNPILLLLDEPTTGLDPNARREIWSILNKLKQEKTASLILTTHYMEEAEYLCDRIVIMDQGKILMQGSLNELLVSNNLKNTLYFNFVEKTDSQYFSDFKMVWKEEAISGKIILNEMNEDIRRFMKIIESKNLNIKDMEIKSANLDDLFILLTGRHLTT
jgi:ABC-2 type transport system ATP-binding protein